MKVREVMTSDVRWISPQGTLEEAAKLMRDLDVGSLPVLEGRELNGMITDRDLAIRAVAEGRDPRGTRVAEVMTREALCIFDDQTVDEAAEFMQREQVRRLPVVSRERELVGIVALGDLAVETNEGLAGRTLEKVSQPSEPRRDA